LGSVFPGLKYFLPEINFYKMIKNFFKITLRNLWKDKSGTFINILSFSTGLAAFLIIISYVRYEMSFEKFNEKADRIFRANLEMTLDGTPKTYTVSANILGPRMKELVPEVENYVRIFGSFNMPAYLKSDENSISTTKFYFADSTLFGVFTLHMVRGGTKGLLTRKNELLISESTALKFFGTSEVEGRMLKVNNQFDYLIKGVFRDFPSNSHMHPEVLAPFLDCPMNEQTSWEGANFFTYILLHSANDQPAANQKLHEIFAKEIPEYMKSMKADYVLFPLHDIHLYSKADFEPGIVGDIKQVNIFIAIALFILLLAVVNYVNLATSKSIERAREVGLRKIMGSFRMQIIWQFMGESALITLTSLILAFVIAFISADFVHAVFQRPFDLGFLLKPEYLLMTGGLWILLSMLSGLYPSVVLSMFEPIHVMKGSFKRSRQGIMMRRILVVFQFIISSSIIIGTIVIYRQLNYMQTQNLGFDKEKVLAINVITTPGYKFDADSFKKQLLMNSNVEAVSVASAYPTHNLGGQLLWGEGMNEKETVMIWMWEADEDYIKTLGLHLIAGKNLNPENKDRKNMDFIINETAMRQFGWTLDNCLGKKINQSDYRVGTCAGVIRDFHFASLKSKIEPMMLCLGSDMPRNILVRVAGNNIKGTMEFIKDQWNALSSSSPFQYAFLDEQYNQLYKNEVNTGRFFIVFAVLAIIIACMGLFALSTFETLTRTKEIGVRKALGSTEIGIFNLLVKNFSLQVLISFVIAVPVSWYLMNNWLQGFAYRITVKPLIFIMAAVVVFLITLLTVGYHSFRAAFRNPALSLRYE
jgi:putative ABC transport system permease protein